MGGYVAMAGESPEDDLTGAEWEFASKTVGQRALILSAGVVMNVVLAGGLSAVAAVWVGGGRRAVRCGETRGVGKGAGHTGV